MGNPKQPGKFSPPLDKGVALYVKALRKHGIETFESCEGSKRHSYAEPTVRFHGGRAKGSRALAAAQECGLPVFALR